MAADKAHRILVTRTDRLGDVLLALPALAYVRSAFPGATVDFLTQESFGGVVFPLLRERGIGLVSEASVRFSDYSAALILHESPWVLQRAWKYRVPLRMGPASKPFSWVFLNRRVSQHRSKVTKHEAEYNLDLARRLAGELGGLSVKVEPLEIPPDAGNVAEASEVLRKAGVLARYVILHPGTGGSALNLSLGNYMSLLDRLRVQYESEVVLSCGPSSIDVKLTSALLQTRPGLKRISGVSLAGLREILRGAECVVAPSTGPLHLAHYVGTRTLGLYAPLASQRWERWSPWGGTGRSEISVPDVICPASRKCLGSGCVHYSCLDKLAMSLPLRDRGDLKAPLESQ